MSTETIANGDALALILSRICIYRFCNRLDSLTLINARAVTFNFGARDLLDCIVVPVIRNRYSYSLLLFIRYYSFSVRCSTFASFLFEFCLIVVRKEKEQF